MPVVVVSHKEAVENEHHDKRGQHQREGRQCRAPYATCGGVADVGGRVDADGAGSHLADGNDVGKFLRREPLVARDHLSLNHREHGISAAEPEQSDFEERIEQLQPNHLAPRFLFMAP